MYPYHLFYKSNETHGNTNLFLTKYFIGPIGFYAQSSIGSKLRKLCGSPRIRKKILESFFVYIVFLKPHFTVLKEKRKKMIKIYALSYQLMLDFWLHKSPGYFSTIPAYVNIKQITHYTFLLVYISLNQRSWGKRYFFHLLLIRSEIRNI